MIRIHRPLTYHWVGRVSDFPRRILKKFRLHGRFLFSKSAWSPPTRPSRSWRDSGGGGEYHFIKTASENPVLWTGMKDASAEGRKKQVRCWNKFSMTKCFGSGLVVIPNLVRDLGFRSWVSKPRPVGGVLYSNRILTFNFSKIPLTLNPLPINIILILLR